MSISLSGLVVQKKFKDSDKYELTNLLGYQPVYRQTNCTLIEATSYDFEMIGVIQKENFLLILDKYIGAEFSVKGNKTKMDLFLEEYSSECLIFCFDVNGIAETYFYSIYQKGQRIGARYKAEGHIQFDSLSGQLPILVKKDSSEEEKFISLLDSILEIPFIELLCRAATGYSAKSRARSRYCALHRKPGAWV